MSCASESGTLDSSNEPPAESTSSSRPLFRELMAADVDDLETSEIESLCMVCREMGITRLLLTKIPMFREVILTSFHCPHCGSSNREIQPGAPIQDQGVRYTLNVHKNKEYLNLLVVMADTASVCIPELQFEIPSHSHKGSVTTVESIITKAATRLEQEQPERKILDDPSGNSFVENQLAPSPNPDLTTEFYPRTEEQNRDLGLLPTAAEGETTDFHSTAQGSNQEENPTENDEVMSFETNCPNCHSPAQTKMKQVDIPHFKTVIVMATSCEYCGYRTNEVKSGTGISKHGTRIQLKLTDPSDLSRDILKAETAIISIPELDFEVQSGTLGGRFTTIEGLLSQMKENIRQSNPFGVGDSAIQSKLATFLEKISEIIEGKRLGVHIVLDDPAGNSYIQNVYAPEPDPEMHVEHYLRTFEQNEVLGLNDMRTEGYTMNNSAES